MVRKRLKCVVGTGVILGALATTAAVQVDLVGGTLFGGPGGAGFDIGADEFPR